MSKESFEYLCQAVLEGTADEVQLEEFRAHLRADAVQRKAYLDQTQMHALLTWQQGRAAIPELALLSPTNVAPQPKILTFRSRMASPLLQAALAASVVLMVGLAFWQFADHGRKPDSMAVQKGVSIDILASEGSPYQVGQRVVLQKLRMDTGSLRFRISSGAVVDVEGPVILEFVNPMRLRLLLGNVTIDVGSEAKGFVLDTASALLMDIGTRFGASVGNDGSTDVLVLEGEVEVYRAGELPTQKSRLASLYEGEAARMANREAKIQRLQALALQGDRLAIRGLNAPDSEVITGVTDNIKKANFYRCYTITPGGMGEGALACLVHRGHRKLAWRAMPDQLFPAELEGADVIGTFQRQSIRQPLPDINLELSRPCAVYVLFDSRAEPPEWLRQGFRDTGLRLRSGPWWPDLVETRNLKPDANGELCVVHSVWRKDVPGAATVTLGAPTLEGNKYPYAMYGIALKPL
jgi:ferric-dicitrate binding protein FerR (iron transport regulator)